MKKFKIWIIFFGTLLHFQTIFFGSESYLSDKDRIIVLNCLDSRVCPTPELTSLLEQNSHIVSTQTQRGSCFEQRTDETTAHRVANHVGKKQSALVLLYFLYNKGETAAKKSNIPGSPDFTMYTGATAFLNLCLQLNKLRPNEYPIFLDLLNKFAARTPAVVIQPRDDGKTPAMAIALSYSPIKNQALQILFQNNFQAFDGRLSARHNCFNIAELVIRRPDTSSSKNALSMIIQDQKDRYPHTFANWIQNLTVYASQTNTGYLPLLKNNTPVLPIYSLPHNVGLQTLEPPCLCCAQQCLCCIQPGVNELHNQDWLEFYSQNPTHPNAQKWLEAYYKRAQGLK